jgi:beta-lactamase regulating signal transducer with metallopeptidase domain
MEFLASPHFSLWMQTVSQAAATSLVANLWQSAVLTAALGLCLRFASRTSASLRFVLWTAAFGVTMALPFLPFLFEAHSAAQATTATTVFYGSAESVRPWLQLDLRWGMAIAALWAIASLGRLVDLGMHSLRLRRLWKNAQPVSLNENPALAQLAQSVANRANTALCTTDDLDRPSVIGFLAPRILIPTWLLAKLTPEELEQIVLHEAEHLRRNDDWTNLLQKLSLILFPLNPVLLWIDRRLSSEREMACDEGVVARTRAPRAYATCLTRLAESSLQHSVEALSLGSWSRRSELVPRVNSILRRKAVLGPFGARGLLAGSLLGMLLITVELSRAPRLVAFVPQPSQVAGEAHVLPSAGLVRASIKMDNSGRMGDSSRLSNSSKTGNFGYRAVPAMASILPSPAPAPTHNLGRRQTPTAQKRLAPQAQPALDANLSVEPAIRIEEQSFIVMTTWTRNVPQQSSDLQPSDLQGDAPLDEVQPGRTGVTRLIFTVPAPDGISPRFAAVPTRMGWLVIQL